METRSRRVIDQAIILGIATAVFVGVRVMAISHGNLAITETLLSNLDPFRMFISSMVPLANIICLLVGGLVFRQNRIRSMKGMKSSSSTEEILLNVLAGLMILIGIGFANVMTLLGIFVFAILQIGRHFVSRLREDKGTKSKFKFSSKALRYDVAVLVSLIFLFYTFVLPTMWVPTEDIYIRNDIYSSHDSSVEKAPITVYVINSDPNYLTTIDAQYLTPEVYKTSDVLSRQICSEDDRMLFEAFLSWSLLSWPSKTLGQVWKCHYPSNISVFWQRF